MIGAAGDQLRGGLAGGGEVKLVLDDLEEFDRALLGGVVIGGEGKDLLDPQVHPALAGTDVANPLQQLVEVIGNAGPLDGRVLEPLVVHRESLDQVLPQPLRRPAAELRTARRAYSVADGQNCIQAVMLDQAANLAVSLTANYPEFPDSCLRVQLTFLQDVLEMLVDRADIFLKQFSK